MSGDSNERVTPDRNWIRSVGDTAAPLLAGFSFAAVIALSDDAEKFRWPGPAVLGLTTSVVTLIAAVQCAKYAGEPGRSNAAWWHKYMRRFYHFGIIALLLGLSFALAPPRDAGLPQAAFRWVASVLALVAAAIETGIFLKHPLKEQRALGPVKWDELSGEEHYFLRAALAAAQRKCSRVRLMIFGSRAAGSAQPGSVYDLFFVFPDCTSSQEQEQSVGEVSNLARARGVEIDTEKSTESEWGYNLEADRSLIDQIKACSVEVPQIKSLHSLH